MNSPIKYWRKQKEVREYLGKKGKIITWTKIFVSAPDFKEQTPYYVALVELESGDKIYGQIVDSNEIKVGQDVESVLRIVRKGNAEDIIEYGVKFKGI